jgi:hypothetical protein
MDLASSFFIQRGEAGKQVPKETVENAFGLAVSDEGKDTKDSTYQRSMLSSKIQRPSAAADMRDDGQRSELNSSVRAMSIAADAQHAFIPYDNWQGTTENARSVRSLDRGFREGGIMSPSQHQRSVLNSSVRAMPIAADAQHAFIPYDDWQGTAENARSVRSVDRGFREGGIMSPSHHQWDSTSIVASKAGNSYREQEVQMTENECLMRIASLQQEIETLKLDIDVGHDKLRSLGDYEESARFIKERVGGNRWAIEGMAAPHCTSTEIDCGEDDDLEASIRDCHGDTQFGYTLPVKINVKGRSRRIRVSRSKHVHLTIESCSLELVLTQCEDIDIVCGGHAPRIIAEDTHHVTISLCFQLMVEDIVQLRCSNILLNSCDRRGIP